MPKGYNPSLAGFGKRSMIICWLMRCDSGYEIRTRRSFLVREGHNSHSFRKRRSFAALRINSVRVRQLNGRCFRGNGSTAITFLTNAEIEITNPEKNNVRLRKPERIFYAPLFLSGIPKRIRQTQTLQIGA